MVTSPAFPLPSVLIKDPLYHLFLLYVVDYVVMVLPRTELAIVYVIFQGFLALEVFVAIPPKVLIVIASVIGILTSWFFSPIHTLGLICLYFGKSSLAQWGLIVAAGAFQISHIRYIPIGVVQTLTFFEVIRKRKHILILKLSFAFIIFSPIVAIAIDIAFLCWRKKPVEFNPQDIQRFNEATNTRREVLDLRGRSRDEIVRAMQEYGIEEIIDLRGKTSDEAKEIINSCEGRRVMFRT